MTPLQVHTALRNALAAAFPAMPTAWPNEAFEPAKDAVDDSGNAVPWMRPTFKPGLSFTGELGLEGVDKRVGAYLIQVFTPDNCGAGDCLDLAGQVETAFRRKSIGGVECDPAPYSGDAKEDAGGGPWFQCNVTVPWWAWIGE